MRMITTIQEDGGRTNIYAREPQMYLQEITVDHNTRAELLNGRAAMLGFVAAVISYAFSGQIIPGVW